METTLVADVHLAMEYLAARCDGAVSEDGQGFSGTDAKFGKRFVAIPREDRTQVMTWDAYVTLEKYRKQLEAGGIVYDEIPMPLMPQDYNKTVSRDDARQIERKITATKNAKIDYVGDEFVISFPYSGELVTAVKTIPGRRFVAQGKTWNVPQARFEAVQAFATGHGFTLTQAALDAIASLSELVAAAPDALVEDQVTYNGSKFLYADDYAVERVDVVRRIVGRTWNASKKVWEIPAGGAEALNDFIIEFDLRVSDEAREVIDAAVLGARALREASRAEHSDFTVEGLGGTLRPFQNAGVEYLLTARRSFLADEMGTGKTVQAIAAVEAQAAYPCIVAVPTVVVSNWAREIKKWVPLRRVKAVSGRTPFFVGDADFVIVGYSVLGNWAEELSYMMPRSFIADESHYLKSRRSQRTKGAKEIGKMVRDKDGLVLLLSGTPLINRPEELITQLEILGRLDDFGGWNGFQYRYVKSADPGRLLELNERLRGTCMVRRMKADVMKELPPRTDAELFLTGDPATMREYAQAERDLLRYLAEKARAKAIEMGDPDPASAAVMAAMRASSAEHLVMIGTLRQLAAKAKIPAAVDWVKDFLESSEDEQLVVFGHHREVLSALADAFDAEMIWGDNKADKIKGGEVVSSERQEIVDRFQAGEKRVLVVGLTAGGMGITLTAASNALVMELPWAPAHLNQGIDRLHRMGQHDAVTAWISLLDADGTIDDDMLELLGKKSKVTKAVMDGEGEATGESGSIAGDVVELFTRRALEASEGGDENGEG